MAIISASLGTSAAMESMNAVQLNGAIQTAFVINACIALIGILIALIAIKPKKSSTVVDAK